MTNKQINRELKSWASIRQDWIDRLVKQPSNNQACLHIIQINSKMEMLRCQWNWNDELVEMEVVS